ncbi:hypothetical protein [Neptunitalea lumnitzerae]|uniref:Uncharacterized protein n=1 Tax=Neptunitalea lumnitzerae TaxID=2965509 RepID=A0ABQ5MHP7_9FLAO|nr:hypothetical protein [Neptunitalea sp. Y10]GLB48892.1 hypothetical protein Y10_12600 [Neptunitalea sp. Y10]
MKIVIGDTNYDDYYSKVLSESSNYTITSTCGEETAITNKYFLKVVDESGAILCYDIMGLNDEVLSVRSMISGKIFVFNRQ